MRIAGVLLLFAACVDSSSVSCPDGSVCPEGSVCATVTNPDQQLCVTPAQISDCNGKQPLDACETNGHCFDGVCLPAVCGNNRLDPGEACDTGDTAAGNGCSADCLSAEVCGNNIVDAITGEQCDDNNNIGHDGCGSTCQAEAMGWEQLASAVLVPPARWQASAAYDIGRGRMVVFGGYTGADPNNPGISNNETWEWGGTAWRQRAPLTAPGTRHGGAMAYDAARDRVVLFGGVAELQGSTSFGDTWEWDGDRWHVAGATGDLPSPRGHAAMAYDPVHHDLVLFGGDNFDDSTTLVPYNDTYTYDGTKWTHVVTTTSPPKGGYAGMAFDPVHGVMILTSPNLFVGTWSFDGANWTQRSAAGPHSHSGLTWDVASQRILAIGGNATDGAGTTSVATMMTYDGTAWTTLATTAPLPIEDAAVASDLDRHRVVIFSGANRTSATTLTDTIEWSGTGFTTYAKPTLPTNITRMAMAFDEARQTTVVFGGLTGAQTPNNEMFEYDAQGWRARAITTPSSRWSAGMAYDEARKVVVLFGGQFTGTSLPVSNNDTWTYDGTTWKPLTPTTMPPQSGAPHMIYDAMHGYIVMVTQPTPNASTLDTWTWDGSNWTKRTNTTEPANADVMAYDPRNKQVVLVDFTGRTWTWDGTQWNDVSTSPSPPPRFDEAFGWNAPRQRLQLFGGDASDATVWEWDGMRWAALTATNYPNQLEPSARANGFTSDSSGTGLLLLTINSVFAWEIWRLRFTSDLPYEGCAATIDADGDGKAGCADEDCWATCSPLCPPGLACDMTTPHCGDGICTGGVETARSCPSDCTASMVCGDFICAPGETCPGDCP